MGWSPTLVSKISTLAVIIQFEVFYAQYVLNILVLDLQLVPGNTKPNTYNSLVLMFVDYSPDMWQSLAQKSKACVVPLTGKRYVVPRQLELRHI